MADRRDRPPCVANQDDVEPVSWGNGSRYAFKRWMLGAATGGKQLGASLFELAPGKADFPFHFHHHNEEAIYVLEGEGLLDLGEKDTQQVPIRAGDYIAFPVGPEGCHRVTNTSDASLRFLCISTMKDPEVAVYPETNKVGVMAGGAPGQQDAPGRVVNLWPRDESMEYFEGED